MATTTALGGVELELVALSDSELVERAYDFARDLEEDDADRLYYVLDEVFERFAPRAAWGYEQHRLLEENDLDARRLELRGAAEARGKRANARWLAWADNAVADVPEGALVGVGRLS